jgi:hypothetical protein
VEHGNGALELRLRGHGTGGGELNRANLSHIAEMRMAVLFVSADGKRH